MPFVVNLPLLGFLLFVSAFFAACETALFSLSKIEKRRLKERHPRLSKWVLFHLDHPRRTLATILIGNLMVQTLAAAVVTLLALQAGGGRYLGVTVFLFTVALILFGEMVPKMIAVKENDRIALLTAFPLQVIAILLGPFRHVTRGVTDWLLSFLTPEIREHPDRISEEELKAMIKIGEEEGVLDRQERYMIQKIFELGERPVRAIMTPRIDLAALDIREPREKHLEIIRKFHFTHFPVYRETIDHMVGVVSVQDYVLSSEQQLSELLFPPLFVPESKRIDDLLTQFREQDKHFAVCVDEYGGTAGIVTQEDILEEVFGEFYDEYAKVENPIRQSGRDEYLVQAKISLVDFNEYFGTQLKSEEATTLAGYILEKLGEVPQKGKVIRAGNCEFRIQDAARQRILWVDVKCRR